jgi:RNA polymerase sigma-70 factor, ECF subfamily
MTNPPQHDPRDAELEAAWAQAQAGDERAYRLVLERLAARLRAYFNRRLFGPASEVEDLVQDTLLALHLQRGTHVAGVPLLAWVHAVARHKVVDALRRHGRREALHDPLDELPEALHPTAEVEADSQHDLGVLLGQLSPAQREAIVHTRLEGLSVAETALRCGQSESAVKVHVHRGLKKLAALWRRGQGGPG